MFTKKQNSKGGKKTAERGSRYMKKIGKRGGIKSGEARRAKSEAKKAGNAKNRVK